MSFLGLVILAATAAPDAAIANPLTPGLAGKLECTRPDAEKKTCRSITSYRRDGAGYSNDALILISPNGPVTIEINAPVVIKGESVCGTMRTADIDTATIRSAGRVLDATESAPLRTAIKGGMAPLIGKEICQTYQAAPGGGLMEKATIDGVYEPKGDEPVAWVAPGDGYSVAP